MPWAPDYITDEEFRDYLRVDDLDDEAEAALAITAASRAIDDDTNRQFGVVAEVEERFYTARPDYKRGYWVVDIDDLMDDDGLVVEVDGNAVATYVLEPVNARAKGRPWTRIAFTADSEHMPCGERDEVGAVALWGWTAFPRTVVQAALLQTSRLLKRRDAPFGVTGSPEMGSELRLLAKVDPDVSVALRGYRRTRALG